MAILAECPTCHKKQSAKNKLCKCGENLDKAKQSRRVKYWISYRMPDGKQRRESVASFENLSPYSIEDARAAESKRKVQRREKRIFEMLPGTDLSFSELAKWYLELNSVKGLASYERIQVCAANFNEVFGNQIVSSIKLMDLENYQTKREGQGLAPATIDMEIRIAQAMVTKGFDNDLVDGRSLKAFRKLKNKLKPGANARKRTLSVEEHQALVANASSHFKPILITAYHTGMRMGELLKLEWKHIDREAGLIRLPAELTKEKRPKTIPINHHVKRALESLPRAIHHNRVFTYGSKPLNNRIRRAFMSACERADIRYGLKVEGGVRFHDIRSTFKTNLLRAGVDKALRDTILGHSLKGMDAYYLNPSDEDLKEAIEKYTVWIDNQFSNVDQTVDQEGKSVSK
jgi:integrase